MRYAILFAVLLLAGCYDAMSRQETIDAIKECEDAGLVAVIYRMNWDSRVVRVDCDIDAKRTTK